MVKLKRIPFLSSVELIILLERISLTSRLPLGGTRDESKTNFSSKEPYQVNEGGEKKQAREEGD